eukprot:gene3015-13748_t
MLLQGFDAQSSGVPNRHGFTTNVNNILQPDNVEIKSREVICISLTACQGLRLTSASESVFLTIPQVMLSNTSGVSNLGPIFVL